ncbi:MAG TPA: XrtA-associated tyrosine autokinase [Burkholderiales bacterium]|nr:XrtA-associated tyrosine autokinase [Burkholderiales bacterium]
MSLIEKAAKRLEELKRTGVAVSEEELAAAAGAPVEHYDVSAEYTPLKQQMQPEEPAGPVQYSRIVDIDLSRLAAMGMVTPEAPHSPIANEFRVVKRPLLANAQGKSAVPVKNGNLIMATSALPGEGKSFSALNLAMSMAMELDSTVLLVDADVANPSLLKVLGLPPARGLMDVLTNDDVSLSDVILRTNVEKLSILPAGTHHQRATEVLASDVMAQLVAEMAARYPDRIIIFDSPPLLPTTESRVLATHMGQVIVIVEADITTHSNLKQALAHVENCPVVLTMLNKAVRSEVAQYYGYYGYSRAARA